MDLGLKGATVVVNGGSKGMGRAAAEAFATEGARVAVLARGKEALDETVASLLSRGASDAVALQADIRDGDGVAGAFGLVKERWGSLNALVNATGPVEVGVAEFAALDDAEWAATFDIAAIGAVRCVRAALPLLRAAQWGRIVNVSAHSTRRQSPGIVAYTAAKAALTSLSKNLSVSLAPEGSGLSSSPTSRKPSRPCAPGSARADLPRAGCSVLEHLVG